MNKEKIINTLIKLNIKASKKNEVPVSALITYNDVVIAKAYNNRHNKNNILGHAEIICINKACKKLKDWRLDKCTLYVSMEPCEMCKKIIEEARIEKVYYVIDRKKEKHSNTCYLKANTNKELKFVDILQNFFQKKR